jgi:hypothetical protein
VKVVIKTAIRFLALAVVYLVCFVVVSGALLSTATDQPAADEAGVTLLALLVVSLINAAVWIYVIQRSRWSGWKLVLAVFLVLYGVSTLMPQIETAYFVTGLPPGMLHAHVDAPTRRLCNLPARKLHAATPSLIPPPRHALSR